jgi:hypothetical protein
LDIHDLSKFKSYHLELDKIYEEEEHYWQQRAKLKWFLEGDHNIKFFHTIATIRGKNIFSLEIDGRVERDPSILSKHVVDFYRNLMGTSTERMLKMQFDFWSVSDKLTPSQIEILDKPFTVEEVKYIIFSCDPKKTPGPDEFSFYFINHVGR